MIKNQKDKQQTDEHNNANSRFNWFPGHMNKTLKTIETKRPMIDLVIELVDSRAPISTQNPTFQKILGQKPRLLLMTKADLADPKVNAAWVADFEKNNQPVAFINYQQPNFIKKLVAEIEKTMANKQARQKERGLLKPQINALVVGIPNVGKSTFINHLSKTKKVKVGNQPGVTRGLQVLQLTSQINLIDSPGVLPAKLQSAKQANILAGLNTIRKDIYPVEEVAEAILTIVQTHYPKLFLGDAELSSENHYFAKEAKLRNQGSTLVMEQFLKKVADGEWPISLEFPTSWTEVATKENNHE
ncbi:ribosome biogenesis GTPase A [Entomoplasma freundtii]|uniref:Ribosome biogenesis GTPase A n=1 Tax=Entomoplasma freundtii TaxID=74700 RepID=A0A2K8NTB1_9MOLU|nr:ribosome biogenesis GTPase YlqF [Entomoplasma freundtii]ATZ16418.1 ribosomal biogenesis GTPase [Entomoplasma freundtii]TDY56543.1 ribosome biogenesis GTPase A [Entomoplasma freundtii]